MLQTGKKNNPDVLQLMVIQTVVHPYYGILLSKKSKWTPDKHNNIDECQVHYAKWKKPGFKSYVMYGSIYMFFRKGKTM